MNNYYIYMHKNKINNKVYIGQTHQKQAGLTPIGGRGRLRAIRTAAIRTFLLL